MGLLVEELSPQRHDRTTFDCGNEPLNRYLRELAVQHRAKGLSTTFVLTDSESASLVMGYYSLSAAALALEKLSETDSKRLPRYPIPVVRIGRLAVDLKMRKRGLGELLLQHAITRILAVRATMGVYAVVVDAKDDAALAFYKKYGFRPCTNETRQMYLPLGRTQ